MQLSPTPVVADHQTLKKSLAAFLRALEGRNRSSATVRAYQTDLLQFFIWLEENNLAATHPSKVERADITEYLSSLAQRKVSGVSRARKLAAVREYFRYLEAHDIITKSPAAHVETPRKERNLRTHLSSSEYNALLAVSAGSPRDYAVFQVFLQTGVRVSELCALRLDDLDFAARLLLVRSGKGMVGREIELEGKAIKALRNYLAVRPQSEHDYLFVNYAGEPISERGVRKMVEKYRQAAGITKRASCHSLRHTFATEKAKKGVSTWQLQEWLGHSRLDTTQIYVHLARQDAHKVMDKTSL
jgi:integrase/recombinase XerC